MNLPNIYTQEIISAGQRLAQQGLVAAHSGNISLRVEHGFLITASNMRKGELTVADVLCLDNQGNVLAAAGGQKSPSSESALHLALYQAYPQIAAIVHAHPPYATALASAGGQLDCRLLEEARLFLSDVPVLAYLPAGSAELARAAAGAAEGANALLLANHGAISWGQTLEQALCRMEILEHTARVMLYKKLFQS